MTFHESPRFPDDVSYGTGSGPSFSTSMTELDSRAVVRVSRGGSAVRRFNVKYGIKSRAQLANVLNFIVCRNGPEAGFRYKDFHDYTSAPDNIGASLFDDVQIGVGDGVTKQFQLIKTYNDGGSVSKNRNILKPVAGTVTIGVGASTPTQQVSPSWTWPWSVDTTTGVVTFTTAPTAGHVITAGFEFDVPGFFEKMNDELFMVNLEAFDTGSLPDVWIMEDVSPSVQQDDFYFGGASIFPSIAASMQITPLHGRCITISAASAGLDVYLPSASLFAPGGPHLFLHNNGGTHAWTLKSGSTTIKTLAATETAIVCVMQGASSKYWVGC